MIVAWIIGLILSFLGIWFLKNSRIPATTWCGKVQRPERPVLRMWSWMLLIIGSVVPVLNIIEGICVLIGWTIAYAGGDWEFTKEDSKLTRFLNRPIK